MTESIHQVQEKRLLVTSLRLKNFKSLADVEIGFRNLTLFMGPNNSGKSSAFQALGFLKQSLEANQVVTNGDYAILGSLRDISFRHDQKGSIEVSCYIDLPSEVVTQIAGAMHGTARFHLERIGITWIFSASRGLEMVCLNDASGERIVCGTNNPSLEAQRRDIFIDNAHVEISGLFPVATGGTQPAFNIVSKACSLSAEVFRSRFRALYYLKTQRGIESRDKNIGDERPNDVGPHGENTIPIFAFIRDDADYGFLVEKINEWSGRFGFDRVFSRVIKGPRHALTLHDEKFRIDSNVVDVGYGTNQLLPVILQCFYASKGSMILIEEPEMHLHPRMQADLVDFFVDVLRHGNRIAIETHSPHILARLQRRIAEGKIKPDDVIINYFEKTENGSKVSPIRIDEKGYLSQRLPGFFEEDFQEAVERLRATMKGVGEPTVNSSEA
jgi:predicted ATPase